MRSNAARIAGGAILVILAVVLFAVFSGSDEEGGGESNPPAAERPAEENGGGQPTDRQGPPPASPIETIRIQGGALAGEVAQIDVATGETVRFRVVADQPWDLHIHGYEVEEPIRPGKPLVVSFPAEIEGAFEAEVHGAAGEFPIAEINVSPG